MNQFFSNIGAWFKKLFTPHNEKAIAVTAQRVGEVVADVNAGNIPKAVTDGEAAVDAAKSITTK